MHASDVKFYKYLSPEASVSVLQNKTLRWSSPKLFNDPFDFPSEIDFSFDSNELADALMEEIVRIVYGSDEPSGNVEHPLFAMSLMARINSDKPGAGVEVFRRHMTPAMEELTNNFKQGRDGLRAFYRSYRDRFAVLSVTKKYDNLLMWAHYAKDHSGCVFKFRCLPEKDRPLCMAQEVKYQSEYPLMVDNIQDYVKHLTGQVELNYDDLFKIFALTKSKHWKYEEEWRCISLLRDYESGFHYDLMIPEELEAVYLGCRIDKPIKDKVMDQILTQFPNAQVYQVHTDIQNYGLTFKKIR